MSRPWLFAVALLFACPLPAFADEGPKLAQRHKAIDALIQETMKRWAVPGLAAVIVRDDAVYYLAGHGVREMGKQGAVTGDTVFPLASLTKAFTATLLGVLVDEGKARWDDRVNEHLPAFRLADPLADRDVTLRDLLCHRTGLARHDLLWQRATWSLEETVRRMAFVEPTHPFRSRYEYCNLTYIAAGQALGAASGEKSWEQATRKKLLDPLGMKRAAFTRRAVLALEDRATPHRVLGGKAVPIEWYPDDAQVRGSGSLKASASEMANWLRMNLAGGTLAGNRVVSARCLREVHSPQVVVPVDAEVAKLSGATQGSYALGWHVSDFHGRPVLDHGGAADGFRARICLLPKEKVGFVLLANAEENLALLSLGNLLMEELLGVEKRDWHGFYRERQQKAAAAKAKAKKDLLASRKAGTALSRELAAYAGTYEDKAYGAATVKAEGKGLALSWSGHAAALGHFHYDTFAARSASAALDGGSVRFELDRDGQVRTMHWLGRAFVRK